MKLERFFGRALVAGLISITFIITSCTDKAKTIGNELDNSEDIFEIGFTDTITVEAYSVLRDSIRTDSLYLSLAGSIFDPELGEMTASMATQLLLSVDTPDFGPNPVIDSMILSLLYGGYYGDTMDFQTFNVYELDEILDSPKDYYTDDVISHKSTLLATKTFQPRPTSDYLVSRMDTTSTGADTLIIDTLVAQIRFDLASLSPELGNKVLYGQESDMSSSSNFVEYVKGLYITAEKSTSGGSISYFDLNSSVSQVVIYYKNDTIDDGTYNLYITRDMERLTMVDHNNYDDASTEFKEQVLDENHELGRNQLYLQSLAGVESIIKFPHIKNLSTEGKIIVNRAELVFEADALKLGDYAAPTNLTLLKKTEDGSFDLLLDQFEGTEFFGGTYNEDEQEYRFRITRYIQSLVSDENVIDYGLKLAISSSASKADRIIFYGTNPDNTALYADRVRLEITYSIVNN